MLYPDTTKGENGTQEKRENGTQEKRENGTQEKRVIRTDIQFLRAIAVILVVLYHLNLPFLRGGFVGVDIFFVISGYLVVGKMITDYKKNAFSLRLFLVQRIKRILVPSIVCLVVVLLFLQIFQYMDLVPSVAPKDTMCTSCTDIFAGSLHYVNVHFYIGQLAYFKPELSQSFVLHYWSLAVEEQFYFLFPILFLVLSRIFNFKESRPLIVFLTVMTVISCAFMFFSSGNAKFFLLSARIWEFLVGALIQVAEEKFSPDIIPFFAQYFMVVLLLIAGIFTPSYSYPNILTIPIVLVTGFFIFCRNPINFLPMELIGNWSYSIYLYHWPVIRFLRFAFFGTQIDYSIVYFSCVVLLITMVLSLCSYYGIEKPVIAAQWQPRTWFMIFFGLSFGVALLAFMVSTPYCHPSGTPSFQFPGFITQSSYNIPMIDKPAKPSNWKEKQCLFSWGDSHMGTWVPVVEQFSSLVPNATKYKKIFWGVPGITQVLEGPPDLRSPLSDCTSSITFISSCTNCVQNVDLQQLSKQNMKKAVDYFAQFGCVILFIDNPVWPGDKNPAVCVLEKPPDQCQIPRDQQSIYYLERGMVQQFNVSSSNFSLWDPIEYICEPEVCKAIDKNNVKTYHDNLHLDEGFTKTLAGVFITDMLKVPCVQEFLSDPHPVQYPITKQWTDFQV